MKLKVIIFGGDEKAVALLDALSGVSGIELAGLCDIKGDSPGILYARKISVETSQNCRNFIKNNKAIISCIIAYFNMRFSKHLNTFIYICIFSIYFR